MIKLCCLSDYLCHPRILIFLENRLLPSQSQDNRQVLTLYGVVVSLFNFVCLDAENRRSADITV